MGYRKIENPLNAEDMRERIEAQVETLIRVEALEACFDRLIQEMRCTHEVGEARNQNLKRFMGEAKLLNNLMGVLKSCLNIRRSILKPLENPSSQDVVDKVNRLDKKSDDLLRVMVEQVAHKPRNGGKRKKTAYAPL